jgi:hypothetical protein
MAPVAQLITNQLSALGQRQQQAAVLDLGHNHPDNSETLRQIALKAVASRGAVEIQASGELSLLR